MYTNQVVCNSCHGSGYLSQYKHIDNGICYECGGSGLTEEYAHTMQVTPNPREYYQQYKQDIKNSNEHYDLIYKLTERLKDKESDLKSFNRQIETAKNLGKYDKVKSYYEGIINELNEEMDAIKNQLNLINT